jgi:hypothetical protein
MLMLNQTLLPVSNQTTGVKPALQALTKSLAPVHDYPPQSARAFTRLLKRCNLSTLGALAALAVALCPLPASASTSFSGSVKGGLSPISGAAVKFFAVGNSGYGSAATLLAQTTSNSSGGFTVSGYTCPAGDPQTYVLATGGNAGSGSNAAIGLMALTGTCQTLGSTSFIAVNELTTVASQWGLAQFIDATGMQIGTSPGNASGLTNAVAGAMADLVTSVGTDSSDSGVPAKFLPTGSQCMTSSPPTNCDGLRRLNSLANILAACVMTSGPSSAACSSLFKNTSTPSSRTTLEAAHQAVTNPVRNVKAIFAVQQMLASPPYQPSLKSAPDGWELALLFVPTNAKFNSPVWVALDAPGNVWIVNGGLGAGSVSELPAGNYNDGAVNLAPAGAAFNVPFAVALDTAGDVFVANAADNDIVELPAGNFDAGATHFSPLGARLDGPAALALDVSNNLWVANLFGGAGCQKNPPAVPCGGISELKSRSFTADGFHFVPSAAKFDSLLTIALDSTGNVWTSNEFGNSVSELTAPHHVGLNFAPASAAFNRPIALALDASSNVWVVNSQGGKGCDGAPPCGSLTELPAGNPNGAVNFAPAAAAFLQPNSVAVDSNGNLWVSNAGPSVCEAAICGSVSELSASSPNNGALNFAPPGSGFQQPTLLAIDTSGNVWVSQLGGLTELVGIAGPVSTPIQACLKAGKNVCRP